MKGGDQNLNVTCHRSPGSIQLGLDSQLLEEGEVATAEIARPIHPRADHAKVDVWDQVGFAVLR